LIGLRGESNRSSVVVVVVHVVHVAIVVVHGEGRRRGRKNLLLESLRDVCHHHVRHLCVVSRSLMIDVVHHLLSVGSIDGGLHGVGIGRSDKVLIVTILVLLVIVVVNFTRELADEGTVQLGEDILLHRLRDLSSNAATVEEVVDEALTVVVVVLEDGFDFSFVARSREGNEADFTGSGVNSDEGAVVEGIDDCLDVLGRSDVDPSAALAASIRSVSMRFDVENGTRKILRGVGQHGLEHGVSHFCGSFTVQLADEDTEGSGFAGAAAASALVAECFGVTLDAAPGNLAFGGLGELQLGLVCGGGRSLDIFSRFEDRDEGVTFDGFLCGGGVSKGRGRLGFVDVVRHHSLGSLLLLLLLLIVDHFLFVV